MLDQDGEELLAMMAERWRMPVEQFRHTPFDQLPPLPGAGAPTVNAEPDVPEPPDGYRLSAQAHKLGYPSGAAALAANAVNPDGTLPAEAPSTPAPMATPLLQTLATDDGVPEPPDPYGRTRGAAIN